MMGKLLFLLLSLTQLFTITPIQDKAWGDFDNKSASGQILQDTQI